MDQDQSTLLELSEQVRQGRVIDAVKGLEGLIARNPDNIDFAYMKARLIAKFWNPKDALWAARAYAEKYPEAANGLELIAWVYYQIRKPREALEQIDAAERIGGQTEYTTRLRAECNAIEYDPSRTSFVVDTNPSEFSILFAWEQEIMTSASESEMLDAVRKATEAGESCPVIAVLAARWYSASKNYEAALACLDAATRQYPNYYPLLVDHGTTNQQFGKEAAGIAFLVQAVERNPADSRLASWLFKYFMGKHKFGKALHVLRMTARAQSRIKRKGRPLRVKK